MLAFHGFPTVGLNNLWGADPKPSIPWGSDLQAALHDAAVSGKPVLAHFYSNNCVPCKMLDAKAFQDPGLCRAMADGIVPVKINVDNHRDLADRYQVNRWPTDVYLFPNGQEIYRGVSPQDPKLYCDLLTRVGNRNRDWITERLASQKASEKISHDSHAPRIANTMVEHSVVSKSDRFQTASNSTNRVIETDVSSEANPYCVAPAPSKSADVFSESEPASPFQLASRSIVAKENRYQQRATTVPPVSPSNSTSNPNAIPTGAADPTQTMAGVTMSGVIDETALIDLDGFCPVSLLVRKEWILGNPTCAVKHRGRIYYFVNEEARQVFLEAPDRFAPVLSGFDIVLFLQTGKLEAGKREFGCWYALDGDSEKMFLFKTRESREQFNIERLQYAQSLGGRNDSPEATAEPKVATGAGNSSIAR